MRISVDEAGETVTMDVQTYAALQTLAKLAWSRWIASGSCWSEMAEVKIGDKPIGERGMSLLLQTIAECGNGSEERPSDHDALAKWFSDGLNGFHEAMSRVQQMLREI